jgi:hypothetical protein
LNGLYGERLLASGFFAIRGLQLLLISFCCANCGVLQGAVPILGRLFPGKSGKMDKQAELLVQVQESLLRFADEYSTRMVGGVDNPRRGTDAV